MKLLSTQFDCRMFITLEKENEVALQRAEMRMVSWMCGVKVKDRFPSKELRERLGIDDMTLVLQQNRLRWYDHVLRKDDDWVKKSTKHPPLVATYVDASHAHTHKNPFNGPLSQTTRVTWYQKGKTNLDFTEARDREWQWHQLGHMQVCTSLQTDNHTSTPSLSFLQAGCPSCRPINSIKAVKAVCPRRCITLQKMEHKIFLSAEN